MRHTIDDNDEHKLAFLAALRGIPGHHVIAAMNVATVGVEWRHCSKDQIAKAYATVKNGRSFSLSRTADEGMSRLDLEALRRAANERSLGNPQWHTFYAPKEAQS